MARVDQFEYTDDAVAELLWVLWDQDLSAGIPNPGKADGDMPRGSNDPSHGGSWMAHVADAHRGWRLAPLTDDERNAVFMYYGLGWNQPEIATALNTYQQAVSRHLERGLSKIAKTMNGEIYPTWQ